MPDNLRKPLVVAPALKGMGTPARMILDVFQKGAIIGGPGIRAERQADGRIRLKPK